MQHCLGSPQQFCLRWNNYQSNLTNVFDQLLQSESFVDVTLACEGHSVKAHKMVLSACSPYFQTLFFENPCKHPIVILKDIRWPELKAVVEFMYKGEINVSQEQIGPLLQVAESLKIRGLADVTGEEGDGNKNSKGGWDTVREPVRSARDSSAVRDGLLRELADKEQQLRDSPRDVSRLDGVVRDASRDLACSRDPSATGSPRDCARDGSRDPSREREISSRPSSNHEPPPSALTLPIPLALPLALSSPLGLPRPKKRRRTSADHSPIHSASSPELSANPGLLNHCNSIGSNNGTCSAASPGAPASATPALAEPMEGVLGPPAPPQPAPPQPPAQSMPAATDLSLSMPPPPSLSTHADDMEIKPGIAEMIREEERAKLLESSHPWLGASTSSLSEPSPKSPSSRFQPQHAQHAQHRGPGGGLGAGAGAGAAVWKALQVSKSMNSKWTQQDLLSAIELVRHGMPIKPAAEKCNIPVMTLWRRTRALGVFSSRAASGYRPEQLEQLEPRAEPRPEPRSTT